MSKQTNSYDNDDLKAIVEEIEGFIDDEKSTIKAAKQLRQSEVKKAKKRAKDLNIPNDILVATIAERKLDRETSERRSEIVGKVKEDHLELFEESSGQLSWFKPDSKSPKRSATQEEVERRRAAIQARTDAEQAEGAAVLDDLTGQD